MISIEALKTSATGMVGDDFPLVLWRGQGRIVASDQAGFDLLVAGLRARYTWDRLELAMRRLFANHTLGIDEMGGGHDAVGAVSLLALLLADDVKALGAEGLIVLRLPEGAPIHQYADMSLPR